MVRMQRSRILFIKPNAHSQSLCEFIVFFVESSTPAQRQLGLCVHTNSIESMKVVLSVMSSLCDVRQASHISCSIVPLTCLITTAHICYFFFFYLRQHLPAERMQFSCLRTVIRADNNK